MGPRGISRNFMRVFRAGERTKHEKNDNNQNTAKDSAVRNPIISKVGFLPARSSLLTRRCYKRKGLAPEGKKEKGLAKPRGLSATTEFRRGEMGVGEFCSKLFLTHKAVPTSGMLGGGEKNYVAMGRNSASRIKEDAKGDDSQSSMSYTCKKDH